MRILSILVVFAMLLVSPGFGELAHEHGEGKGHGEMQSMQGMPGMDEGIHGMHEGTHEMHEGKAATLREAASILKATHPDLAVKLEEMAQHHEGMKS